MSVVVAGIAYGLLAFAAPAYISEPMTIGISRAAKSFAPYAGGFFLFVGLVSLIRSFFIRRKFDGLGGADDIRQLSWRQFESIVGEAFRRRGYSVIENAVDGPDGGIDLLIKKDGRKFYVQCKQWKQNTVSVKPVRELLGVITAGGADGGFFVSSGRYTQDAIAFARKTSIELIDGDELAAMVEEARAPQPFMDPTVIRRAPTVFSEEASTPECPACGGAMVQRTAKRGANAGSTFWGCMSYPKCRGTRAA